MKNELLNCKVCGGQLEIEDETNGILKCRNCGNKCLCGQSFSKKDYVLPAKTVSLIEETTTKELDKNNKRKRLVSSCNLVRTLVFFFTLIYIVFVMFLEVASLIGIIEINVKQAIYLILVAYLILMYAIILLKIKSKNNKLNLFVYIFGFILENALVVTTYVFLLKNIVDLFV